MFYLVFDVLLVTIYTKISVKRFELYREILFCITTDTLINIFILFTYYYTIYHETPRTNFDEQFKNYNKLLGNKFLNPFTQSKIQGVSHKSEPGFLFTDLKIIKIF